MGSEHYYDGSLLVPPTTVQLADERNGFTARAFGAQGVTITLAVDDPVGALAFEPFKTWRVKETVAPVGSQIIWAGFVKDRRISRRIGEQVFPTGTGRRWEVDIEECNAFIRRRLLLPTDGANREAETIDARIAWLLTTVGFTGGLIVDGGLIASSTLTMDPMDYTAATGDEVLNGCAVRCGFVPYIRYREGSDDYELIFLDFHTSVLDASGLQISNDPADVDYVTTWPPNPGAILVQSAQRRASGMGMPYPGGFAYEQRGATQAVIGDVDLLTPAADVKTQVTAIATLDRLLEQQEFDEELVRGLTILVDAAHVNDARHGQLIGGKFIHFPTTNRDWTTMQSCRVLSRTVRRPDNQTPEKYQVDLELAPVTPLELVASLAQLQRPNKTNFVVHGTSPFLIDYDNDGDHPGLGCSGLERYGNLSYAGPLAERTGIQADGTGTVTVRAVGDMLGACGGGTITLYIYIYLNGSQIAYRSQTTTGGARVLSFSWDFSLSVPVVPGDQIETWFQVPDIGDNFSIPAGVGNCAHQLLVTGDLAA